MCLKPLTGAHSSQLKSGRGEGAKQSVLWAGNKLVTRPCSDIIAFVLLVVVEAVQPCCAA
jgi:hypothetical protein